MFLIFWMLETFFFVEWYSDTLPIAMLHQTEYRKSPHRFLRTLLLPILEYVGIGIVVVGTPYSKDDFCV